jgi:3',5'-cyclic AMP phosphodiesterase CpdA
MHSHSSGSRRQSSRRDLIKAAAALTATGSLAACASHQHARAADKRTPKRLSRLAHLTDIHVQPEDQAPQGFAHTLDHLMNLPEKPDTILTGGDLIMDAFGQTRQRTAEQWDLYTSTLRDHTNLPIHHCLGNHDIWGWNKAKSNATGDEPAFGKRWATDLLQLPAPHYAFRLNPRWKCIVLDSVQPDPRGNNQNFGYVGGLDDQQFDWLKSQLAATPADTFVCVLSHIPIIHCSAMLTDGKTSPSGFKLSPGEAFTDATRLVALFLRHPNVKLAISGHIHTLERTDFQGVAYLNNGAVCGNWWASQEKKRAKRAPDTPEALALAPLRCEPGYALIDLFDDGSFSHQYIHSGWTNVG